MYNQAQIFSMGFTFGLGFGIILSIIWYINKTWKNK